MPVSIDRAVMPRRPWDGQALKYRPWASLYRADFLTAFLTDDLAFFLAAGALDFFLDAAVGAATPVLTASFPSAVPMASAALVRNGV
jgi:hypothetical protein